MAVAGDEVIDRLGMVVAEGLDGPDQRQLVQPGKQLGNPDAVDLGGDGPEGTVGLGIPRIDLAGAALQSDQDAGLGLRIRKFLPQSPRQRLIKQDAHSH